MPTNPALTNLGTPCARSWTQDWVATVNAKETELNHRICGARLPDATPCTNESDHPSGRCPFHGGFDLTGAPPGNRNHVIHGLYTRRLRPCTPNCPHYQTCPIAKTLTHHENRHPRACPGEAPSEAREDGDPSFPSSIPQSAIRIPQSQPPQSEIRNPQSEPPHSPSPFPLQTSPFTLQTSSPTCPLANLNANHLNRHPRDNGDPSSEFPDPSNQSHTSDPSDPSDPSDSLQTTAAGLQPSSNPQSAVRNPQSDPSSLQPSPNPKSEIRSPQSEGSSSIPHSSFRIPHFPTCPYQLLEYNTVLTDALAIVESQPHPNPMGIHTAHNVATLQVLVSNAAAHLARASSPFEVPRASSPCSSDDACQPPNPNAILAFTRLMREFRHSLKLLQAPAHPPLNRQNSAIHNPQSAIGSPTPEGILRHAQRIQHDTGLDPDSLAAAQLPPQTPETHAKAFIQQAALAGGQGRDVEMCEAFDNATLIDEEFATSERDHVLASYRPAKHSVSEELAELILGHLHLPPQPENTEKTNEYAHATPPLKGAGPKGRGGCSLNESAVPAPPSTGDQGGCSVDESAVPAPPLKRDQGGCSVNEFGVPAPPLKGDQGGCFSPNSTSVASINEDQIPPESAKILQNYLDIFRHGKIPPQAFPIGSPQRAHAESIYTGPSTGHPGSQSNGPTTTPKLPNKDEPAASKLTSDGGSE